MQAALRTHPALTSFPTPKPDILAPPDLTQTTGTGELLRFPGVQNAIETDFIVLPCDLVSELEGSRLYQQWMTLNPLSTSSQPTKRKGGLGMFYPTYGLEGISNKKDETDFIATIPLTDPVVPPPQGSLREDIEHLVMAMPTDTLNDKLDEDKGIFKLRQQLTRKYGRVKLKTKHRDAHVYIFPKWVKDFVARNERFDSISEDVLGWWAKAQWQPGLAERLEMDSVLEEEDDGKSRVDGSPTDDENVDAAALSSTKVSLVEERPSITAFASRLGTSRPEVKKPVAVPPLLAYVQPALVTPTKISESTSLRPFIRRVDTTAALLNVSLYLAKQTSPSNPLSHEHRVHPTATVGPQTRVAQEDSLVAENVTIGSRANIKETVVGAGCEIGNNVRLTRCLLMEGAVVGDGVTMSGCVIGRRARVEGMKPAEPAESIETGEGEKKKRKGKDAGDDDERTKLTDCEVAPNFVVEVGTEAKGEKMMAFDTDESIEDLDEEEETDDDEYEDS